MPAQYADRGLWNGGASVIDRQRRVCCWARAGESTDSGGHWAPSSKCGQCVMSTAKGRGLTDTCFCFGTATTTSEKFNTTTIARTVSRSMHQAFFCRHGYGCSKKNAWWSTFGGSVPELQNVADLSLTCRGWVFLWLRRSVIAIFQSKLRRWIPK